MAEHAWNKASVYTKKKTICELSVAEEHATEENQDELAGEMLANARLIAAAPQMLEALEKCADYWHLKHNPGIPEHGELLSLTAESSKRLIKAAIRAAKGE